MKGLKSLAGKKDDFFSLKNCIALVKWPRTASSSRLAAMFLKLLLNEKKRFSMHFIALSLLGRHLFFFPNFLTEGPFCFESVTAG